MRPSMIHRVRFNRLTTYLWAPQSIGSSSFNHRLACLKYLPFKRPPESRVERAENNRKTRHTKKARRHEMNIPTSIDCDMEKITSMFKRRKRNRTTFSPLLTLVQTAAGKHQQPKRHNKYKKDNGKY